MFSLQAWSNRMFSKNKVTDSQAIDAVIKQAKLAFMRILGIKLAASAVRLGSMVFHTPTKVASVPKLEKPHMAYVAMAEDRGYKKVYITLCENFWKCANFLCRICRYSLVSTDHIANENRQEVIWFQQGVHTCYFMPAVILKATG